LTEIVGIRFKPVGKIYYFSPAGIQLETGDGVIVETARGVEYGRVAIAPRPIEDGKVIQPLKAVMRKATEEDEEQLGKTTKKGRRRLK
jgi:cell fate regulator YaaT (PSP1 superfamily)